MDEVGAVQPDGPEERPLGVWPVIGGAVLGFVTNWILFGVILLAVYAQYGDSTSTTQDVIIGAGLLGMPLVFALLLIPRRTRRWGAGFLLGFAIGSVSSAGVCAGFIGLTG